MGFDGIARAAGTSRTTLYRWWHDPQELLLDALLESAGFSIDTDPGAPVLERLRSQARSAAAALADPPTGAPLRALAAGSLMSADSHAAFAEHWLAPRRAAARALIERGIEDGTIANEDPEVLTDVLFAPIYHRAFFTDGPLDHEVVDTLIRLIAARQPAQ